MEVKKIKFKNQFITIAVVLIIVLSMVVGFFASIDLKGVRAESIFTPIDPNDSTALINDYHNKVGNLPANDYKNLYVLSNVTGTAMPVQINYTNPFVDEFDPYCKYGGGHCSDNFISEIILFSGNFDEFIIKNTVEPNGITYAKYYDDYKFEKLTTSIIRPYRHYYNPGIIDKKVYSQELFIDISNGRYSTFNLFTNLYENRCYNDILNGHYNNRSIISYKEPLLDGGVGEVVCDDKYTETRYIYLVYEVKKYTATFQYYDTKGEKQYTYITGAVGDIITPPEVPLTIPYATFLKWNQTIGVIQKDVEYTAIYNYESFMIFQYDENGILKDKRSYTYYSGIYPYDITLPNKEVDGITYKFIGWSTVKGDKSYIIKDKRLTSELHIYPIYERYEEKTPFNLFSWIGSTWKKIGNWNILGWNVGEVVQWIIIIALIPVSIFAIKYIVIFIKLVISWIKTFIKSIKK